jgi:hypothetical protein
MTLVTVTNICAANTTDMFLSFPHLWHITKFATRITQWVLLVQNERLILQDSPQILNLMCIVLFCFFLVFFSPHWSYILFIERRVSWWPSWLEVGIIGHKFGRGPSKDHSTKDWLQLAQWFLRRRFLCEYTIGSYVKLSSAVGVILVEGPNRRTHFWRRTIQWLFHQNFVLIEQMVSDKNIFMWVSHRVLC